MQRFIKIYLKYNKDMYPCIFLFCSKLIFENTPLLEYLTVLYRNPANEIITKIFCRYFMIDLKTSNYKYFLTDPESPFPLYISIKLPLKLFTTIYIFKK